MFPCSGWISENLVLFVRLETTASNCNLLLVPERRKGCFFGNVFLNQQKCSWFCVVRSFLQKISVAVVPGAEVAEDEHWGHGSYAGGEKT